LVISPLIQKNKYKFVLQKKDYDCGVAAVATALVNTGSESVDYEKLGRELRLSENGVLSDDIFAIFLNKKSFFQNLPQIHNRRT